MDVGVVCQRVREIASVRATASADPAHLQQGLRSVAVVRAWLAAAEAALVARLAEVASFPEKAIADASRGSQGEASRALERAGTLGETPRLAEALDSGSVTPGHVDAVTRVGKGLEGEQRARLLARANNLAGLAAATTASEFRRRLEREARQVQADAGTARFERQQRAARLRRWTDDEGMWCLHGRFDPLTGLRLNARLNAEIEALFAESVPPACPTDPVAKHEFLAACALARIFDDGGVAQRAGRPEFIVVVEAGTDGGGGDAGGGSSCGGVDGGDDGAGGGDGAGAGGDDGADGGNTGDGAGEPRVDWGLPVELPIRVLADLFGQADVHTVIVRNGVVLHAPGQLQLGRTTRLANRAQRRALRALYSTCAVPGCQVSFDKCKIHHVRWWRHGGRTDLHNLLPICVRHHSKVHSAGWVVSLGDERQLTIRYPDGSVHATGPPCRRAA